MQWCAWRLANVYSKTLSCIWITVVTKGYEFIYSFGKCLLKHPLWVKPWRFKNEPYCLLSWTSIPSLLPWALCLANFHSSFRTQILPPPRCLPHSSYVLVTPCTFTFMALIPLQSCCTIYTIPRSYISQPHVMKRVTK